MKIVLATTKVTDVKRYLKEDDEITLYILDAAYEDDKTEGIRLAKEIRGKNRNAYIVFNTIFQDTIYQVMSGLIRPAGFYNKPLEGQDLGILIGDIYRDYLNLQGEDVEILHVNIASTVYNIEYDRILYFEALRKKLYIHTTNQRIGYYESLTCVERMVGNKFVRCHRSYLVNRAHIKSVSFAKMTVELHNGVIINITRTYKNKLREVLGISETA